MYIDHSQGPSQQAPGDREPWASAFQPPAAPSAALSKPAHGPAKGTAGVTAHSDTFLEEVFRPEQGRRDGGWVGPPGLEEVPGQAGMAHGDYATTWEEQQEPRLGIRVSRDVALQKATLPLLPPCQT